MLLSGCSDVNPPHLVDPPPCNPQAATLTRGISRRASADPNARGWEPHLAADGQGNLLVAWIVRVDSSSRIAYALSHDDGATFDVPRSISAAYADPVVAS